MHQGKSKKTRKINKPKGPESCSPDFLFLKVNSKGVAN